MHQLCPLCKKRAHALPNFPYLLHCSRCRLAWLKKFPKTTYNETYYEGISTLATKLFTPIATGFYLLRSVYAGFSPKKLWVDVGAGDGGFLKTVRAKRKIGVEISSSARVIMKKIGIETMTDKQFLHTRKLNADVISFWHVLEHTENPWDYLIAAKNNIAKNGCIVIGIPNIDCLEFYLFGTHWFHSPQFHLWQFTPHSMGLLLKRAGFRVQSIDYWSIEHHLPCLLQSFINASAGSDGALHRFIKRGHGSKMGIKDAFWSIFWLTAGFPIVLLVWIIGALTHKSGTFVVVAR